MLIPRPDLMLNHDTDYVKGVMVEMKRLQKPETLLDLSKCLALYFWFVDSVPNPQHPFGRPSFLPKAPADQQTTLGHEIFLEDESAQGALSLFAQKNKVPTSVFLCRSPQSPSRPPKKSELSMAPSEFSTRCPQLLLLRLNTTIFGSSGS